MESSLLFFPATLDALPQAQACIAACRQEVDADTVLRMQLAIEELFVNSVHYGRGKAEKPEMALSIRLSVHCAAGTARVCFEDSAPPFDPFADLHELRNALAQPLDSRREGGMGRLLVRELADDVSYERRDGWNCIELRFCMRKINSPESGSGV